MCPDRPPAPPAPSPRPCRSDVGQALPVVALLLALAGGVLLLLVVPLGRVATDRARARTAADAAALAGAVEGPAAARQLATANGGRAVAVEVDGRSMTVTVRVGAAEATARADVDLPVAAHGPGRRGLAPAMLAAIDRAEGLLGRSITVVSGFRSRAEQQRLWDNRHTNPYPVAPPGTSRHESGYAIDVPRELVADLRRIGPRAGLCSPLPVTDPIHFELCRWRPT